MAVPITEKQKKYLDSLLKKSDKELIKPTSELTKFEAMKLISYFAAPTEDIDPAVTALIKGAETPAPVFEEDPGDEDLPF